MKIKKSSKRLFHTSPALFLLLLMTGLANSQQIIKFDAPNAGTVSGSGTSPAGINALGVITGYFLDDNYGAHGFVGSVAGGFTSFDAPGADPVVGCTCPAGINDEGAVTGNSVDTNGNSHGFVRTPSGKITIFDVTGAAQGTFPGGINDIEEIEGIYVDGNGASHGFVRAPNGAVTSFDPPGSTGTFPETINNFGAISGVFYDTNGTGHSFVRDARGQITTFDPPHSVNSSSSYGSYGAYINDLGVIGGEYFDDSTDVVYSFVRSPQGRYIEFAAPNAGTVVTSSDESGTYVFAINLEGATTGLVLDNNFGAHSFVRTADGKATTFDVPGQAGSAGAGINALGVIVGRWHDPNFTYHGYLRLP